MDRPIRLVRRLERTLPARQYVRPVVVTRQRAITPLPTCRPLRNSPPLSFNVPPFFVPDPYVDYGRFLTPEGGILIIYKDLDLRWRHTIWRVVAWSGFTGVEGWFLLTQSPVASTWINILCLIVIAIVNWLIVAKPVELYRQLEIRHDCMILDGEDVFWARFMENGWPTFRPDAEGNCVLSGHYGTRFVEFLTVRRFDEFDRMPEVMAAHVQDAMRQLWGVANI